MSLFLVKTYRFLSLFILTILLLPSRAKAEEVILAPNIQGYSVDEIISAEEINGVYYLGIQELSQILQFKYTEGSPITGAFLGKEYTIIPQILPDGDYKKINGHNYFSIDYYESIFPIKMEVDPFEMQLKITSDRELPLVQRIRSNELRQNFIPLGPPDTFSNYQFDNRMFSTPVLDLTYQKGFAVSDYNGENEQRLDSDYYQANFGMLLGGLDAYGSIFGDNNVNDNSPRARFTVGRTFLDEPKNALNLTTFEAGDVTGFNSTLFNDSANGRGAYASSFKDLVMSADKTIDINGPLSDGWDVELYLNDQLIGFRQSGINGRYQFANVPVNYGLNAFKLVFYGPYGEVQTEERNYYSGTSPVKSGEFGYTVNAYQKDRYLIEDNEPYINPSDKGVFDFTGYYGINDNLTLISGVAQSPDPVTDEELNFGTAGLQVIWSGASFQYNTMYNFDDAEVGHHFDVQGNVYIGDLFARYDYYGKLHSPISYYNDQFLKDIMEWRLTGYIPWVTLPYYLSYQESTAADSGDKIQEAHARLSPNFMNYYNFTVEDIWYKDKNMNTNDIVLLLQAQYGQLGLHGQVRYRLDPDTYLYTMGLQGDYRWNKNTYFQANWDRDCRSEYSNMDDLDIFSVSAGRLFPFGGLTLALSADTDNNAAISLTYNMSFGKVPDRNRVFTNAQTQMSERAAMYARAVDEKNEPLAGTKLNVTGLQDPVVTDENGEALIADIEPYQKTILTVDVESIEDISLTPEFDSKKLVLRPGTVLPLTIPFSHRGALEGAISGPGDLESYKVALFSVKGTEIAAKYPEQDGSFIFDDVAFGQYNLVIANPAGKKLKEQTIYLEDDYFALPQPVKF